MEPDPFLLLSSTAIYQHVNSYTNPFSSGDRATRPNSILGFDLLQFLPLIAGPGSEPHWSLFPPASAASQTIVSAVWLTAEKTGAKGPPPVSQSYLEKGAS